MVCIVHYRTFHSFSKLLAQPQLKKFSLKKKSSIVNEQIDPRKELLKQPTTPVRTRFAPSPTGFLHLGSLRTALYNYLLARATGGQFLLRLEDTDQTRLVPGAEQNIYDTLKWLNMSIDEGPVEGGPYGPYVQSKRSGIYAKYADELIEKKLAYRCFCDKERLNGLRDSAKLLKPPTTVSYDRHCYHNISLEESNRMASEKVPFTLRLKAPEKYPEFIDLLHGLINHQPQINLNDIRYDDPILVKSDGLPTYHFANVIDDHLMKITHVIRGEEWLASTAKHIAMYDAFGWEKPSFIHIPLLTTVDDKKLSKRSGDIDIMSLKNKGYLNDALINFSVLFGWSPKREQGLKSSELFTLKELEKLFRLDGLTTGNAKVSFNKLEYFNKEYLKLNLENNEEFFNSSLNEVYTHLLQKYPNLSKDYVRSVLKEISHSLVKLNDLYSTDDLSYFFESPIYSKNRLIQRTKLDENTLTCILNELLRYNDHSDLNTVTNEICKKLSLKNKNLFQTLRYVISGDQSGIKLPVMLELIGFEETQTRIRLLLKELLKK